MNPTRIQLRYDTLVNWEASGTLNIGELGIAQKPDGSVEARVGTSNSQTWTNAKPLSISQDELGLNIEEIGRVYVLLNLGKNEDLTLSSCLNILNVDWSENSTTEIFPKQSFPSGFCGGQQFANSVSFFPFRILLRGNDLVGYQSSIQDVNELVGFVHPAFGNTFNCSSINNQLGNFSEAHPIRPLASDGAKLVWLKNVEVWSYYDTGTASFRFVQLVDGWFPDSYLIFQCNQCPYGNCFCPSLSEWACLCSNNRCPCDYSTGFCPTGTSFLFEEALDNTDFNPSEYNVVDYFVYGSDEELVYVYIPYYSPKDIKVQGYTFDKSVPTFDRTTKNWVNKYAATFDELEEGIVYWDIQENEWKITDTLEGGIY